MLDAGGRAEVKKRTSSAAVNTTNDLFKIFAFAFEITSLMALYINTSSLWSL